MQKLLVLQSQKNLILQTIIDNSLNPSEFAWLEEESDYTNKSLVSTLKHISSEYFFTFDIYRSGHWATLSPGETKPIEEYNCGSWIYLWEYFETWLKSLKREIESPDLWSAIAQESELINATNSESDNFPFNKEEKKYILSGINEIRQYLLEVHKMDAELIEPRLKYLEEASERLGRKDWKNVLLSVIIGIILNATVTPESSRDILRFAGTVLHQILQNLILLN
jgi:hypothetical protein